MKKIEIVGDNYSGEWHKKRVACRAIVVEEDRILLSYEALNDQYMLPGGGLEGDESETDCCRREVAEETGYLIETTSCALEIDEFYGDEEYINYYYFTRITGNCDRRLTEAEKQIGLETRWLPLKEAIDIFSRHDECTEEMRRGLYQREYTALKELLGRKNMKIEWKEGTEITVKSQDGVTIISANEAGLKSLAEIISTLADETSGSHLHLDEYNSLEDGSTELIIEKTE